LTHHNLEGQSENSKRRSKGRSQNQRNKSQGNAKNRRRNNRRSFHSNAKGALDAFELFCAYHLGLSPEGKYRQQNIHDIARSYNKTPAEIKQLLVDFGIDADTMIHSKFDITLAQLDIQVAPEGINKKELAKSIYEDFMNAPKKTRDWQKELAEDAAVNKKTFEK